ncbi:glycosyltransferase [Corallococcus sp. M34]|uniref:glycosyltransferase n=1 Tax=Citreicoccus inhibens TaxID=2849499 RepID=UPI001C220914|nr:glycosyltransferase [Citreicoccus inhibens]MBU8896543.1 glycosyltransferase [Citreicoccus inhibens]
MSVTRVCLVTDELYPFTAGGIGRINHNLIQDSLQHAPDVEFHVLLPDSVGIQPERVELFFGGRVKAHVVRYRPPHQRTADADGTYPPLAAFRHARWHGESLEFMRFLKAREAEGLRFDVIEFPDFHGWAFCSLQEKHLGLAFRDTTIAVRLHTSYGVLMNQEPNTLEVENVGRFEIERKSLLDADHVVAHLGCIAEFNRSYYGFDASWMRKVTVEFPPVVVDAPPPGDALARVPPHKRNLLFITKIQQVKRPDMFVRAAVLLMRTWKAYEGLAVLACHCFEPDYLTYIKSLVPADLRARFVFTKPGPDREALMRSGVVVITSDFESLNLTAYEASAAGSQVVLNGKCLAFGDDSPFVDGVNCQKYDGGLDGLAEAMRRALEGPLLPPVAWSVARPFWETRKPTPVKAPARTPLVSVVITNYNLGRYLPEAIRSVAASTYPEVEVIVVDDGSTDPFDAHVLSRLERAGDAGVRVLRSPINRGLPGARNLGLRAARGEYVLPLDADDCIGPEFLAHAVAALEARQDFSGVVPTAGSFHSDEELAARQFVDFITFLGDCPTYSLVMNRMSCATALLRRSVFEQYRYNESLHTYEDWDLFLRLVQGGHRLLVTNQVHFFHRRRPGSMRSPMDRRQHFQLLVSMYEGLTGPLHPSVRLFALLSHSRDAMTDPFGALHPAAGGDAVPAPALVPPSVGVEARPLRYNVVDMMNSAIKQVPLVHPMLKQVVGLTNREGSESVPLRYSVVDRVNTTLKRVPFLHRRLKKVAGHDEP